MFFKQKITISNSSLETKSLSDANWLIIARPNGEHWVSSYLTVIFPENELRCLHEVTNPGLCNSARHFSRRQVCTVISRLGSRVKIHWIYNKVTHLNLTEENGLHLEVLYSELYLLVRHVYILTYFYMDLLFYVRCWDFFGKCIRILL